MFSACQCRYQHDECGLRQVEVCDQTVQNLELVARIDENVGPAAARADRAVLSRCGFNRPAACRTDTDDASAIFLRLIDHVGGIFLDTIELRVHMMIQYIRNLDRPEGSQTHMKCDVRDLDSHFLNLCQELSLHGFLPWL